MAKVHKHIGRKFLEIPLTPILHITLLLSLVLFKKCYSHMILPSRHSLYTMYICTDLFLPLSFWQAQNKRKYQQVCCEMKCTTKRNKHSGNCSWTILLFGDNNCAKFRRIFYEPKETASQRKEFKRSLIAEPNCSFLRASSLTKRKIKWYRKHQEYLE